MNISLFSTSKDKKPFKTMKIADFVRDIRDGTWEPWIKKIRAAKNMDAQKKLKNTLPAATLCGTCIGRNISKSSGYIGIDVDEADNDKHLMDKIPSLHNDQYIHAVWRSSRGKGLWLLFKIDHEKHIESFLGIEEYLFKKYGIVADSQCKDNSRLCYVSSDPEAKFHNGRKTFKQYGKVTAIPGPSLEYGEPPDFKLLQIMVQQLVDAKKDVTHNYQDWMRLGMLFAECGTKGKELFQRVSQFNSTYDKKETDRQFEKCVKKVAAEKQVKGSKRVSHHTLAYLLSRAGIKPNIPSKKGLDTPVAGQIIYASDMKDEGEGIFSYGLLEFKISRDRFKCTGVNPGRVAEWLYKQGYRYYGDKTYYHINTNVVSEVFAGAMYNNVFMTIKNMPKGIVFRFDESSDDITKDSAMSTAHMTIKKVVDAISLDTSFDPLDTEKFLHDSIDTIYLKFLDCIVSVDKKGYKKLGYDKSPGYVWKESIRPHNFIVASGSSDVDKIFGRAIGTEHRQSFMTAIGYMLSTYYPPAGVPMLFCCDLIMEDGMNNGGNGKDFMKQVLAQFRNVVTVPAKSLDLKHEFALHTGNKDTEIFWFEDLNRSTKMDMFYNFTNGVQVRRMYTPAFTVQAKIGVSLQHTIDMEGSSNERRQIFLLFDNYFGNLPNGIASEYGQVFGTDWPPKKRAQFNQFIVDCCQLYLRKSILKMPTDKLSEARKEDLGGEMYGQLKLDTKYTSQQAMDAVSRGGASVSEMSQKFFVMNWRKWCEHMDYELTKFMVMGYGHYVMSKKSTFVHKTKTIPK